MINNINIYYDGVSDLLTKHLIRKKEIYRYPDLVEYIKGNFKVPYEFELISDGKLLHSLSDLFATGNDLDVIVAYKYIRNIKEVKEDRLEVGEKGEKRKRAKKEDKVIDSSGHLFQNATHKVKK